MTCQLYIYIYIYDIYTQCLNILVRPTGCAGCPVGCGDIYIYIYSVMLGLGCVCP